MYVEFWGTRGSLPASMTARQVREKIFRAIRASRSHPLATDEAIGAFIDRDLPFAVRGSYGSNTACVEIGGQEEFVLCDAGTGLRDFGNAFLRSGKGSSPAVFHLFLSHLHWDHLQGFPFFIPAYRPGNRIHIYGCHADIEAAFVNQQAAPCFPVPFHRPGGGNQLPHPRTGADLRDRGSDRPGDPPEPPRGLLRLQLRPGGAEGRLFDGHGARAGCAGGRVSVPRFLPGGGTAHL